MKVSIKKLLVGVLFFSLLNLAACEQKPAIQPSGKRIKMGVIGPFTKIQQAKGQEGLVGIETAKQLQPYAYNGDKIELVVENDMGDPKQTLRIFKKLVEVDHVAAILLLSDSNSALAVSYIADQYYTPVLTLYATHPNVTLGNHFVSQLVFDSTFQGEVAALYIRDELLIDRVAIFTNPDSANSIYLASEFIRKFQSVGGEVVDNILLTDENDYATILKSLYDKKPDLLYLPIAAEKVLMLLKVVKELNWDPVIMTSDGLVASIRAGYKESLSLFEGVLTIDFYSHDMSLTEYGENVKSVFISQYDRQGSSYMVLGAEGYSLFLHAMNNCDNPADRLCINEQLRTIGSFTGFLGKISFSRGKVHRPLIVSSIHKGKAKFQVKVY